MTFKPEPLVKDKDVSLNPLGTSFFEDNAGMLWSEKEVLIFANRTSNGSLNDIFDGFDPNNQESVNQTYDLLVNLDP